MLKRQIFGRAGFQLLRRRILLTVQSRPVGNGLRAGITIRGVAIKYEWRGDFDNASLDALHADGFGTIPVARTDWRARVEYHSLGWVCAWEEGVLSGFVNVGWDGGAHAFILDTVVARDRRSRGVGAALVAVAVEEARAAKCEWLHVDFEEHLRSFYFDACGFTETSAGLIAL
jgi:GNAT superfamily N-acetyltransferase